MAGSGASSHVEPSHSNTIARAAEPSPAYPTAKHDEVLEHETDQSLLLAVPGLGLGITDQADPSHCSTNVAPDPEWVRPTATHDEALTHETDRSTSSPVPGLGLDTSDHTDPSHCSTHVR